MRRDAPLRVAATASPAPAPWRDGWCWLSALSVAPLVLHSLGAPLGEPVADDFDFIHHVWLLGKRSLLDGGGSEAFWRPVAHQLYYLVLGPLILSHPGLVSAIHVALLALAAVLLYRTLRMTWSGAAAAASASFPFLAESTRALISWPSHFVDLGSLLFSILAVHEALRRRMATSLIALAAALLCKEMAIVAALMIPLLPRAERTTWGERVRWAGATGAVTLVWGVTYLFVRRTAHLALPHHLETDAATLAVSPAARMLWSVGNSLRAVFSLPAVHWPGEVWLTAAVVVLVGGAVTIALLRRGATRGVRLTPHWLAWGLAWFALSSAALTTIFPTWAPNRSLFGAVGFGIAITAVLSAAYPALLIGLLALRLTTFAVSPGPPSRISLSPREEGAFIDFERLTRLQRLMRETRKVLRQRFPTLPHHSNVGTNNLPRSAEYAYGGDHALQVWYADTTLHWLRFSDYSSDTTVRVAGVLQFQQMHLPQLAMVETAAMRAMLRGSERLRARDYAGAQGALDQAEALQVDGGAVIFRSQIGSLRATSFFGRGLPDSAAAEARRALALAPENTEPRFLLAFLDYQRGRYAEMRAEVETLTALAPDDSLTRRYVELARRAR